MGPISAHLGENLMPTDRGVALYRRRVRQLVRALAAGEAPPQPQQLPGEAVRTYGQDSVMRIPAQGQDDRAFLKSFGRAVMQMQFDAEALPLTERDARIIEELKAMERKGGSA